MGIKDPKKRAIYNKICGIILAFAVISYFTSEYLDSASGPVIKASIPVSGGEIGPIEVDEDYTVYQIEARQNLRKFGVWSYVSGEVLDSNKNFLFGFGEELWKEQGVDSDGYWHEQNNSFHLKVTLPMKGVYYFRFKTETDRIYEKNLAPKWNEKEQRVITKIEKIDKGPKSADGSAMNIEKTIDNVEVEISRKFGSSLAHFALSIIAAIVGCTLLYFTNKEVLENI